MATIVVDVRNKPKRPVEFTDPDKPQFHHPDYLDRLERWELYDGLRAGTDAMREAGITWLPREPAEEEQAYRVRVDRSFLSAHYDDAINKLVAKPFSKPLTVKTDEGENVLPDDLQAIVDDADLAGTSLTEFASDLLDSAITYGVTFVLVEFPDTRPVDAESGERVERTSPMTLEEQRNSEIRPYFAHITAPNLISWQTETPEGTSKPKLTSISIYECITRPSGLFGVEKVERIRVITESTWQLFEKGGDEDDEFVEVASGPNTVGKIPLVAFYTSRDGFLTATSPLDKLADANLAHWQSQSDQRNILRFARSGLLAMTGVTEEELEGQTTIGPRALLQAESPDAKIYYVEHSGKAIEAGRQDLKDLEEHMMLLGLQPLMERQGERTATEVGAGEARNMTAIQAWIRALEEAIEQMFEFALLWMGSGAELPPGFAVAVFSNFAMAANAGEEVKTIMELFKAGLLSAGTALQEIQRRGLLSDEIDIEAEIQELEDKAAEEAEAFAKQMNELDGGEDSGEDDDDEDFGGSEE